MKTFIYTIALLLLITASSCVKEKSFPVEPVIEFKDYSHIILKNHAGGDSIYYGHPYIDTAYCTIKFTDGDGDVGNAGGGTSGVPDFKMVYLYEEDGSVMPYENGKFYPYDADANPLNGFDTLMFTYQVPYLTPIGNYKSLIGEIKAKIKGAPIYTFPNRFPQDTLRVVKFYITLRDRAGHISNGVYTNEITVP